MRRFLTAGILVLVCFLLQTCVFHALAFNEIVPNLLIILTSSFGFMCGRKNGLLVGFSCGLLLDVFYGSVIGFNALVYMYIGYTNGSFRKVFFPEDVKLPLCLIALSDVFYSIVTYALLFLLRGRFHFGYYFSHIIIPEVIYTITVALVLYPIILRLNYRLEESEKRSARKFVS
ncbi:MAG: rod shape-determining protein MreD [Lachnospiraceae bacterium]|nr:rod shape-determining protein MreD [Lachnospiraceae bacterium]